MKTTEEMKVVMIEMEEKLMKESNFRNLLEASLMFDELVKKGWAKKNEAQIKVAGETYSHKYSLQESLS